jgi:opacity protein-like surface antigen
MHNFMKRAVILLPLIFVTPLLAQSLALKPYYGYSLPQLSEVNDQMKRQIEGWQTLLGASIASPGEFSGKSIFGGQVQYHLNDDYFLALDVSRYQQKISTEYLSGATPAPDRFYYERSVETFDVALNLDYYFGYDPESRLNKYFGIGVGMIFAQATSLTQLSFAAEPEPGTTLTAVDTRGDFSGNSITGAFLLGLDWRLSDWFFLWTEGGYRYAKVGQMDGTVSRADNQQDTAFTTTTSFDFSGFFVHAGLGIGL